MPDDLRDDLIDVLEAVSKAQLDTLRRLRRSSQQKTAPGGTQRVKSMSQVDMVHDILRNAGRPLHISEIMTLVDKRHGVTLDRESIVSALAKRVARKDRFIRTGPNTFSVLPDNER
jgi:HB1, ASXL, restriction endonuclease HTH domain